MAEMDRCMQLPYREGHECLANSKAIADQCFENYKFRWNETIAMKLLSYVLGGLVAAYFVALVIRTVGWIVQGFHANA